MRRVASVLVLLPLLLAACGDEAKVSKAPAPGSREALARRAFDALKADDVSILAPSFATAEDITWMTARYREAADAERVAEMEKLLAQDGGAESAAAKRRESAIQAFRAARKMAASDFDWAKAEYAGMDEAQSRSAEKDGLEGATVHFLVRAGEQDALFRLRHCLKLRGIWMTFGGVAYVASPHASRQEAMVRQTQKHIRALESVVGMFRQDHHGRMPTGMEELFGESPRTKTPYLTQDFGDAWGNPFTLDFPTPDAYRIRSSGPDGVLETEDDVVWPLPEETETPPDGE